MKKKVTISLVNHEKSIDDKKNTCFPLLRLMDENDKVLQAQFPIATKT